MNILICISHVPDTTTRIKFTADGKALDKSEVTFVINPYDEFALSKAIDLKEAGQATQVDVVCVGNNEVEPTLRKALAVGADEAFRIDAEPNDAYTIAYQIAEFAKTKNYGMILAGKESIDSNGAQVPMMIAEMLDLPAISYATALDLNGETATLKREIDGGEEVLQVLMPFVASCHKGIAEWKIANMRGIMSAKKKPLTVVPFAPCDQLVFNVSYQNPPAKSGCNYINDPVQLANALHEKGLI